MKTDKTDIAMDATDLTQLSSREQLSALMDSALPADETRFLLRRLQHDASLAECWERWRLSGEVMRGLAPAQRLPADFALRVAASLRDGQRPTASTAMSDSGLARMPGWLRWGGGAAVAASVAVAALMARPVALEAPTPSPALVESATQASPATQLAAAAALPQAPAQDPDGSAGQSQAAALASAVAVAARPQRTQRRGTPARLLSSPGVTAATVAQSPAPDTAIADASQIPGLLPRPGTDARPWPRSVLPQYGNAAITVGFGDAPRGAAAYNPFQPRTGLDNLPPAAIATPAAEDPAATVQTDGSPLPTGNPSTPPVQP